MKPVETGHGTAFGEHCYPIPSFFATSGEQQHVIRSGDKMVLGTSLKRPSRPDEPLDIDEETLDSALMDLLTSDWQTLDDGDPHSADALDDRPPVPSR